MSSVNALNGEWKVVQMENTGRDELRDSRAGWLTPRVLRRRYCGISSHDATTKGSNPDFPTRTTTISFAFPSPPTLAFDIRGSQWQGRGGVSEY
jgi:hypothetical protein